MQITNFNYVKVGRGLSSIDVYPVNGHENNGVVAMTCGERRSLQTTNTDPEGFIQLRKLNKSPCWVALFSFNISPNVVRLPDGWEESVVLWDSRNGDDNA